MLIKIPGKAPAVIFRGIPEGLPKKFLEEFLKNFPKVYSKDFLKNAKQHSSPLPSLNPWKLPVNPYWKSLKLFWNTAETPFTNLVWDNFQLRLLWNSPESPCATASNLLSPMKPPRMHSESLKLHGNPHNPSEILLQPDQTVQEFLWSPEESSLKFLKPLLNL